ncbi:probable inactive ATP-dependent zinc metalloprotease FTSHI 4, chloroplastic [Nicotiana tomentosiformis]|uniref:probable inactive ATP-dependent zinc metalloprotease FTSHI 4, chloroplastic n=1 Tax=Nicotiana tomentosiformis TaxID=4098 RepID=UPI00051AAF2A|nr:probable inactive ATP-dependent zinc metalloprotease FTSHI 4, chloroplastic [Nicotiana tomentosiformis]XP_009596432.1 probable inactive ATP-dependent zinc metalloprotease FTSHI 4, chloroplastic [Nicotiana tomentosiformis]XP_009596434.1 probable inactive ATP-dependent zinc metalloprotease FTSHI 4, chloroplastic [Nicotiana tomentosiformis]
MTSSSIHLLKPSFPPKTLPRFSPSVFTPFNLQLRPRRRYCFSIGSKSLNIQACKSGFTSTSNSNSVNDETESAQQLFEKLKEAERERINKLEEFERKANVQLERQLLLASEWSRKLLAMQGKLKGTEWDPENSHKIDYSQFQNLLNANNVQFMEYSNYGQTVSVILPYYKDGKTKGSGGENRKDIVFKRHVVDRMPIDCWNDVWRKLHQQLVNVDVYNVNNIPAEVYSTVATAVVWSMRLALSVVLYIWIDNKMRPIYSKLIPCDLGSAPKKISEPQKQRALGSLGKSRAKFISAEEKTGITFDDFAGQEYIKRELQEIVRILKNEDEFQNKGIYCPKGVLLHGPPGTGKTLLAKAIAGEAGLPFFAANGTDFVEMFAGVAASRVKDLFSSARSFAPSIIFIDEIDAIGSKRGGPDIGGGGAEREQGLLQILTEMDGFKVSTSQVLVIGATNRLDILDPALLRKGRFDKIIRVGLPSKDGRLAILMVHARNKFFRSEEEKDTLLQEIAELTEDFTGAELQNILNEAGILTARKDLDYIGRDELLEALKRQKGTFETGQEDSTEVPEELTLRLAYREAAVAVLACYLPDPYRPFTETDIKSIRSQPNMQFMEIGGRVFKRKADYVNSIVRACAPRVIEEKMFGVDNLCWISAKATLEASRLAEFLILQTGLTALGKAYYRYQRDLVPNLPSKIEALRDEYMRYAVEKCLSILKENHAAVETITDVLLEEGEIKADEIWSIYKSSPKSPQPTVCPVDEYGALIYAGRWGVHGVSLPGRVTFAPGNVGFSTFGAPRPMETQIISDETWKLIDGIWDKRVEEIKAAASVEIEEDKEKPQLLMPSHFL